MERIGIGVIGLGHNGLAFCERYAKHPGCRLVAVCDRDEGRAKAAADRFGVPFYTDYEILNDRAIDAVSVHTPDNLHKEPFLLALESGRHVFVEKPMADTVDDVREMVAASLKHPGQICQVGHVLRFDRYFSLIKKWVDLGILGDLFYLEADYIHDLRYQYYMEDWKVSKEIPMLGGGCHPLDILRWYAGDAVEVSAMSNHIAYPQMQADATMIAMYKFKNGAVGKVTSLYGNASPCPYGYNLSVYGTKGTVVRDRLSLDGMGQTWSAIPDQFDPTHEYSTEIDHFLECIRTGKKPLVTPAEAANTVVAALAAVQAAKENKVLKIPDVTSQARG